MTNDNMVPASEQLPETEPPHDEAADNHTAAILKHVAADDTDLGPPANHDDGTETNPADADDTEPDPPADHDDDVETRPADVQPIVTIKDADSSSPSFRVTHFANINVLAGWFLRIHEDEHTNWRMWLSRRSQALLIQITLVSVVLVLNLTFTVFSITRYGSNNGVGVIYDGDCDTVGDLDQYLHLLINLLSTGMLSASNYCMQLQAAPTRADVDAAHRAGKSLDIGIPSLRNLKSIDRWSLASWLLLALSSVPIHFIFNSAVFQSLTSDSYTIAVVKDSFLDGASWSISTAETNRRGDAAWDEERVNPKYINEVAVNYTSVIEGMQQDAVRTPYQRMNVSECFSLYERPFTPQSNALIFVNDRAVQTPPDDSLLMYVSVIPRSDNWPKNMWALGGGFTMPAFLPRGNGTQWLLGPQQYDVSYCLVQPQRIESKTNRCRFEFSPPIMVTVCCLNFVKAAVMVAVWTRRRWQSQIGDVTHQDILYTLGDAISSFMRKPDETTRDMGLATKWDFASRRRWWKCLIFEPAPESLTEPRAFRVRQFRWWYAASSRRWLITLFASLLMLGIAAGTLGPVIATLKRRSLPTSIPALWNLGFGLLTENTYTVGFGLPRRDPAGLISNVLVANLPQFLYSMIHILLNAVLSTLLVQRQFSMMASRRKTLRVSEPRGLQRSSYFISLPLRYSLPLAAAAAMIHWLMSRSLFLARITAVWPDGTIDATNSFSTCGHSPIAIFITLLVGFALVIIVMLLGLRKYDGTMRMVSTNSRAISAACHALEEDRESGYLLPLQWGVVEMRQGIGKVAFTTAQETEIKDPVPGTSYR